MNPMMNRRRFVQASTTAALALATRPVMAAPEPHASAGLITVRGANYCWQYNLTKDVLQLSDARERSVFSTPLQPAVVIARQGEPTSRIASPGKPTTPQISGNRLTLGYRDVNGEAGLQLVWRFEDESFWLDSILYRPAAGEDLVSLHLFASIAPQPQPAFESSYLVVPGLLGSAALSPIINQNERLDTTVWLGRGSSVPGLNQQWALPVHYFAGFSMDSSKGQRDMLTSGRSQSFCCGLAALPAGDLFLSLRGSAASLAIDYRSDLWHHLHGPAELTLGCPLVFTLGEDDYEAIAAYYDTLLKAGIVRRKQPTPAQRETALRPQFCTWGAQIERHREGSGLDQGFLETLYQQMRDSGMQARLFSIDDKWEGTYGNLTHDANRLPHFESFLGRLRSDGMRIGLWAALMRCEHPAELGLNESQMLARPDGTPFRVDYSGTHYYILDFTRPEVADVLTHLARRFMERYKPDLLKFDFGYELPALAEAAPFDKRFTGERLMQRGLEIVLPAMRAVNPDLVVMYYSLSPLLVEHFDLHSPDDLCVAIGEYQIEANRRFYFSSLLGLLGIPTYGSSGYDWASSPSIWFDAAAMGSIGSLNDFAGDELGLHATPEMIALYNGIAHCLRNSACFEILPIGAVTEAPTLGAHARSWARFEADELVLLAHRPADPGNLFPPQERSTSRNARRLKRAQIALQASMPVVVASGTADGIEHATKLALAACGSGEVLLRRASTQSATLLFHYLDGSTTKQTATVNDHLLRLSLPSHSSTHVPFEWLEITFA